MYHHLVKPGETLWQISLDYRTPLENIIQANSGINPNYLTIGQALVIPGFPDPTTLPYEIKVSLTNHRLSLFQHGSLVKEYPIAVGKMLTRTPTGQFIILNKAPNPGGPYGTMWMSLSKQGYGIHGTNNPSSIGHSVSHGCIRMHNHDVEELASMVPIGTRVIIGH
ncbi:L,D-transpeptidase family protein [Alkalihalobacillus pseudalcaliphilus]|uniref:L,D-transpeptidase family protein n=1 Tax=Alkalihalobacillus pseudalcaliphilus TaxID=79884 RepID=UPI00064DABA4|nr:L,D-transpeptidase family protein [Alkalihalobacillus pseudalcaliphilus]KMK76683.1 L,D-transpeptidase [Alkalihalobacillus pseudalcaliphilus]